MRALISKLAISLTLVSTNPAIAQFSQAISVNDTVISEFEINQRVIMLSTFRTPGNLEDTAREQLIEDRLKLSALKSAGLRITDEGLVDAMTAFATRADLELDQFIIMLEQSGIYEETFRDFVRVNVSWRDFIQSRFSDRAQVSEDDINLALGQSGTSSSIEILLNEIIISALPENEQQAMTTANRIAQLTSTSEFEAEARRVSALPSKTRGGRLDWVPISNYPAGLRGLLLDLAPGEITAPLRITNGVALFQMRSVREVPSLTPELTTLEYATFYIANGRNKRGLDEARRIDALVDTCDDLYGVASGLPTDQLERNVLPAADVPADIAIELAKLDAGEASYMLTRDNGETLVFLMMCGRTLALGEDVDRETIRRQLRSQRLNTYAAALLADLRAAATITYN